MNLIITFTVTVFHEKIQDFLINQSQTTSDKVSVTDQVATYQGSYILTKKVNNFIENFDEDTNRALVTLDN